MSDEKIDTVNPNVWDVVAKGLKQIRKDVEHMNDESLGERVARKYFDWSQGPSNAESLAALVDREVNALHTRLQTELREGRARIAELKSHNDELVDMLEADLVARIAELEKDQRTSWGYAKYFDRIAELEAMLSQHECVAPFETQDEWHDWQRRKNTLLAKYKEKP